jgi:hypothetical protein
MTNPAALRLEQPLEIDDARRASRRLAELRREAEDSHETMTKEAAEAERVYRKKYAEEFIRATGTAGEREAKAKAESADEAYVRDLKAGMVKVQVERLRGLEGERSQLKSLTEWSMRLNLDERAQASQGHTFGRAA